MTTTVLAAKKSAALPAVFALFVGVAIMIVAGHVQATTLHDVAHDARHATGFPCH